MATRANYTFRLGETIIIDYACHEVDGSAMNLTGGTFTVRLDNRDGTALLSKQGVHSDAANGLGAVTITADNQVSASLKVGVYPWFGTAVLSDGQTSVQGWGDITIEPGA
jgi:hypothetical protein